MVETNAALDQLTEFTVLQRHSGGDEAALLVGAPDEPSARSFRGRLSDGCCGGYCVLAGCAEDQGRPAVTVRLYDSVNSASQSALEQKLALGGRESEHRRPNLYGAMLLRIPVIKDSELPHQGGAHLSEAKDVLRLALQPLADVAHVGQRCR